jgi:hypothetical protein
MPPRPEFALLVVLAAVTPSVSAAAELGQKYDSYRDLHDQTQYGTLFLNEGAIRLQENRWKKRFVVINGAGEINLPSQQGYCFVFNHYGAPNGVGNSQTYRLKISKVFSDGRAPTEQTLAQDFTPTDSVVSSNLPDWCVAGTLSVSKVSLEFSSDDGYFNRKLSFAVK